jgi:hypothetical protein
MFQRRLWVLAAGSALLFATACGTEDEETGVGAEAAVPGDTDEAEGPSPGDGAASSDGGGAGDGSAGEGADTVDVAQDAAPDVEGGAGDSSAGPDAADAGPPPLYPEEWSQCTEDADCAVAWPGCCDLCNGGAPVAVRAEHSAEVGALLDPAGAACQGVTCGAAPCPETTAQCQSGRCVVDVAKGVGKGCGVYDSATCAASPVCFPAFGQTPEAVCTEDIVSLEPIYGGCVAKSSKCFDIPTCAWDPQGFFALVFPASCLPAGWTPCGADFCALTENECSAGLLAPGRQLCVRGQPVEEGELLAAGATVRIDHGPKGCFPKTCAVVHDSQCGLVMLEGGIIGMTGLYCLSLLPGVTCSGPCDGTPPAECTTPPLSDGLYTVRFGKQQFSFTVPSVVPPGGLCVDIAAP